MNRNKRILFGLILGFISAIQGCCKYYYPQKISDSPNTYCFNQHYTSGRITAIEVYCQDTYNRKWLVTITENSPTRLSSQNELFLTIGEIPSGFKQLIPESREKFVPKKGEKYILTFTTERCRDTVPPRMPFVSD